MVETQVEPKVVHSTFVVERSYSKPPETVFAAFADPAKLKRWYGAGEQHEVLQFSSDFRVGGTHTQTYKLGPQTPVAGLVIDNRAIWQDIQPNQRIVAAYTMDMGDKRISASLVTVELLPEGGGTRLVLTSQGAYFEGGPGPAMIEAGWNSLADKLGRELED